ncbi:Heat shock protein DnaJ [Nitrobacter sp. Nb-311A]|uniref:DnaJ domain-containing protein n=1 Tax=unclassified Nitrobacter TaxID=2620411 RepID=UPI0000684A45|nr:MULTISPECIES: DnaJ domain-containing protein [unclassified Nitrobacter]EAQ34755.1 Heat shock protein DnaJ [Nitrobacter sp. Nb-311A]MCB1392673.1 DnaJ domain-containing protein [Nitrobacter sp.]MCV0385333.1 DnaJ domain-containing protein [Nitrobacter sp.]
MPTLIAGLFTFLFLYLLLQLLRAANPAVLARAIRLAGGIIAFAMAAFIGIKGELALALPLAALGVGLLGWSPSGMSFFARLLGVGMQQHTTTGHTSRVRSQFLDMVLDHDSGRLGGQIIDGPDAGRSLDDFDLPRLLAMMAGFDAESCALLETYLDRRFPAWRHNAQGDPAGGRSDAPPGGKMTDEEAYQILGLQPGAGRDEIRRAHRGLMKKLHPDQGGSTYLAARVNAAKDTLLRTHRS